MPSPRWFVVALRPVACAVVALGSWAIPAWAQLSISPLRIESTVTQGQAQGVITLQNIGTTPSRVRIYAEPFTVGPDGLEIGVESDRDLTPYLLFSPRELVIEPGQTRRVRALARLLPSMGDGEFRAIIFAEPLDLPPEENSMVETSGSVRLMPRFGVFIYARQGDVAADLAVLSATVQPENGRIALLVANEGNATARPRINWALSQNDTAVARGTTSEAAVIAGEASNLLIDHTANQETPLAPGTYTLSGTLTWSLGGRQETLPFSVPVTLPAP